MDNTEATEKIIAALQNNDAGYQRVSAAMLSGDKAETKQAVHDVAGVDLTDEQLDTLMTEYADKDKIAAMT